MLEMALGRFRDLDTAAEAQVVLTAVTGRGGVVVVLHGVMKEVLCLLMPN